MGNIIRTLAVVGCLLSALPAQAAVIEWTDWQSGTMSPGLMRGKIGTIHVTLTAPSILSSQAGLTVGEPVYWQNRAAYKSPQAENAPVTPDIVKSSAAHAYTITFSEPVTDPVIAIVSLGGGALTPVMWNFGTTPVTILSQGPGAFGGTLTSCVLVTATILQGQECHGVIQLVGTYTTFSFTQSAFESWTGWTVGVPLPVVTPVPTPTPTPVPTPLPTPLPLRGATLTWDYTQPVVTSTENATADGFHLYRAEGAACTVAAPLTAQVGGDIDVALRTIIDASIPGDTRVVCYEMTAFNAAGESAHTNRATRTDPEQVILPPVPTNLQVR